MCGILGVSNSNELAAFTESLSRIKHRGPDETIVVKHSRVLLGMHRLAIQDLQRGMYPFEHDHKTLIFNGELYNLGELHSLVGANSSYTCKTQCDAETILPLFSSTGISCFRLLKGMFAIAIFDAASDTIHLARDMFGEKPLYYATDHKRNFWFSSELKAFPKILRSVSVSAIGKYLQIGYLPTRETVYENIFKVLPGECVSFNISTRKISRYRFESIHRYKNVSSSSTELEETLKAVITEKMVSDVPVGAFLSGGIDSSLVTALMSQQQKTKIHTFSISFPDNTVDESSYSTRVAEYLHTNHHQFTYTSQDIVKNWESVLYHLDEPLCDPAVFPTYLLSQKAKRYVSVVLTGEGADEIFCGYDRYKRELQLQLLRTVLPNSILDSLKRIPNFMIWKIFSQAPEEYLPVSYLGHWILSTELRSEYKKTISELWKSNSSRELDFSTSAPLQRFDLEQYVAEQLCMKLDKMAMAHSLETRAPFLDSRLLPFLPSSAVSSTEATQQKRMLKKIASKYLPSEVVYRRKQGFSLPLRKWITGDLRQFVENARVQDPIITELYGKDGIRKLLDLYFGGKNIDLTVWNLLTVNSWLKLQKSI